MIMQTIEVKFSKDNQKVKATTTSGISLCLSMSHFENIESEMEIARRIAIKLINKKLPHWRQYIFSGEGRLANDNIVFTFSSQRKLPELEKINLLFEKNKVEA